MSYNRSEVLFDEAETDLIVWSNEFSARDAMTRKGHHMAAPMSDLPR